MTDLSHSLMHLSPVELRMLQKRLKQQVSQVHKKQIEEVIMRLTEYRGLKIIDADLRKDMDVFSKRLKMQTVKMQEMVNSLRELSEQIKDTSRAVQQLKLAVRIIRSDLDGC